MMGRWMIGAGVGATLCAAMGAVLGSDAAGQVNRFYSSPRLHAERPVPVVEAAAWNRDETPSTAATIPAAGAVWLDGGATGSSRTDGSTLIEIDRAVERATSVRVHRSRPTVPIRRRRAVPGTVESGTPEVPVAI